MWNPNYAAEGLVKALTALISIATAFAIWPLIPKALRIPTVDELEERIRERTWSLEQEIEQRKEAEARLLEARNEAERANQAKSSFLSVMSHELRTPLNAILGYAQILEMTKSDHRPEMSGKYVENIQRAGGHLLALIEDLLDLSRIESGRMSVSPKPVDLQELLNEVVDEARGAAEQQEVSVELADSGADIAVHADRVRLRQALNNLVGNAIKYNDPGGHVVIRVEPDVDGKARIQVEDDGWGVPVERRGELFKPMSRLGREQTEREGAGIGLALSKRIAELLDGDLTYAPGARRGSIFSIVIPLSTAPLEALSTRPHAAVPEMPEGAFQALYIEDNPSNADLMDQVLRHAAPDSRFVVARTGAEGLKHATSMAFDVIFLDIGLPDMSGFDVIDRLSERLGDRLPPIVIVTADATKATERKARRSDVFAFLTKPFKVQEVMELAGAIGRGRAGLADA